MRYIAEISLSELKFFNHPKCLDIDLKLLSEICQQDVFAFDIHCEISNKYSIPLLNFIFFFYMEIHVHIKNNLYIGTMLMKFLFSLCSSIENNPTRCFLLLT